MHGWMDGWMNMHSADYTLSQLHNLSVCFRPVCLSHAGIVSKRLNIFSNLLPEGSHSILIFPQQTLCQYSDGDHPNGMSNECAWV